VVQGSSKVLVLCRWFERYAASPASE
jgi:uncharacterized protein YodC (DUF2158 family)